MSGALCLGGPEDGNYHVPNCGPEILRLRDRSKFPSIHALPPAPSPTLTVSHEMVTYHLKDIRVVGKIWYFWVLDPEADLEGLITRLIDGYRKPI